MFNFKVLRDRYAKDDFRVYYEGKVLSGINPDGFVIPEGQRRRRRKHKHRDRSPSPRRRREDREPEANIYLQCSIL